MTTNAKGKGSEMTNPVEEAVKRPMNDVITRAHKIIRGERREDYGDVNESFQQIAQFWSAYLRRPVSTLDVANLMILLKVSRASHKYHDDSYVDICGYAGLAEMLSK